MSVETQPNFQSFLDGRITVKPGDITVENADAVVNAANPTLFGGGGVDGAIHRVGGAEILAACKKLRDTAFPGGLPTGEAVITTAGNLPAKFVIHTVGPVYGEEGGREAELLAKAYIESLQLAAQHGLRTIAFPSISTGTYQYPKDEAARISSRAIVDFLIEKGAIKNVSLVFFSRSDAEIFLRHQVF